MKRISTLFSIAFIFTFLLTKCKVDWEDCYTCYRQTGVPYEQEGTLACSPEAAQELINNGWDCPDYNPPIANNNPPNNEQVLMGDMNISYPPDNSWYLPYGDTVLSWEHSGFTHKVTYDVYLDVYDDEWFETIISEGQESTTCSVTLSPQTRYKWRVRAYLEGHPNFTTHFDGEFATKPAITKGDSFEDPRDGRVYKTINVGDKTWMAENLAYEIPGYNATDSWDWQDDFEYMHWAYYNNDKDSLGSIYGILYQVQAAKEACPSGWHAATQSEWDTLALFIDVGRLKEVGIDHWTSTNSDVTNETGFTALPGGYRAGHGGFKAIGTQGRWYPYIAIDTSSHIRLDAYIPHGGFSVRCVKD